MPTKRRGGSKPIKPNRKRAKQRTRLGMGIEAARVARGLTMAAVSSEMGVAPATVSDWEWGRYPPTVPHLMRLAELLDTTADALLGGRAAA